jgi:hypothetical protein
MNSCNHVTGLGFFRDMTETEGVEEAMGICGRYLEARLDSELSKSELAFCRKLFAAMQSAEAEKVDISKLVYPYDFQKSQERLEESFYRASEKINAECALAVDRLISASCYQQNDYNLELAAMKAIHGFGFARVNLVLAREIQRRIHEHDRCFSDINKSWSRVFSEPEEAFRQTALNARSILLDGFTNHLRRLYNEAGAAQYALPGRPESGETVHGYEIIRAIVFDDLRGFALGNNPDAASAFVTWQFTLENDKRGYFRSNYVSDLTEAAKNYIARIIVHMANGSKPQK